MLYKLEGTLKQRMSGGGYHVESTTVSKACSEGW